MNILYRYLSSEAIENCITCLNFCFDKVVFFGYERIIKEEKQNIQYFLENKCNVITEFVQIDGNDLGYFYNLVNKHLHSDGDNYFDMTGNEGLLQVAMTNIAYERNIPMHIFDVWNNEVSNIDDDINGSILNVDRNSINKTKLNIEEYIKMVGGTICYNMNKPEKNQDDCNEFNHINIVKNKCKEKWIVISAALQKCSCDINNELHCYARNRKILLDNAHNRINDDELIELLNIFMSNGLIENFRHESNGLSFNYKSKYVKCSILEAGSILEQDVYNHEKQFADDCRIGIHLDWDDIESDENDKIINEIDVLKLNGYVLTFISCKDTEKLQNKALYELETVTRRFGGKYSKMMLVCANKPSNLYKKRASSIGIEVICYDELIKL